ncbi:hypothetical protein [Xanthomonas theicola]|uniref:hypothetical protein n=1 Tax=Xanthomonas theicola TaxID=56464 RepID=UPI001639879D|nr:hypothetical protein [Xanthomonas theicola]QNH24344.1 hypothetical protein G4Q83_05685 [Xanthomonas theicola]
MRKIGRRWGRRASTLGRQVGGLQGPVSCAHAAAAAAYRSRRSRCVRPRRLLEGSSLFPCVDERLVYERWSPQQIAAARRDRHPDASSQRVSHERIAAAIDTQRRGGLNKALIHAWRGGQPTPGRRRRSVVEPLGIFRSRG